jgi:hypothetical protein
MLISGWRAKLGASPQLELWNDGIMGPSIQLGEDNKNVRGASSNDLDSTIMENGIFRFSYPLFHHSILLTEEIGYQKIYNSLAAAG